MVDVTRPAIAAAESLPTRAGTSPPRSSPKTKSERSRLNARAPKEILETIRKRESQPDLGSTSRLLDFLTYNLGTSTQSWFNASKK
jgi:hypothetical protein